MPPVLVVKNLGKRFQSRDPNAPRTLQAWVQSGMPRSGRDKTFWALRGVSFSVEPGEMLGVVGNNGAGKSTLLRLLGGVMRPSEGHVTAHAPVSGLLDLNAGAHPDLTGRENAIGMGILWGLTRQEITSHIEDVIDFAELRDFIDEPVRTYSAGMRLRLGFAVAVQSRPRILLIDEVLAVGDVAFQRKCLDRINAFRADGCAIILISHDLAQVEATCDRVLWLGGGTIAALGPTHGVLSLYQSKMLQATVARTPSDEGHDSEESGSRLRLGHNRFGSQESRITDVRFLDGSGKAVDRIRTGEPLSVVLSIDGAASLASLKVAVNFATDKGVEVFDSISDLGGLGLPDSPGAAEVRLHLERLDLACGTYAVSVGIYDASWSFAYDQHSAAHNLQVDGPESRCALSPPQTWSSVKSADVGATLSSAL